MKLKNYLLLIVSLLISTIQSFGQDLKSESSFVNKSINAAVPFVPRLPGFAGGNIKVKGDVVFVGNQIINRTTTLPSGFNAAGEPNNLSILTPEANTPLNSLTYNGGTNNGGVVNFEYIDVDVDPSTFSSSEASLALKNPNGSINTCKRIRYAGLYWAALYPYERSTDPNSNTSGTLINPNWNTVKFKVPGGTYQTLSADSNPDPVGDEDEIIQREYPVTSYLSPYVCYKNVTSLFTAMETAGVDTNGIYTVADQRAARGRNQTGLVGGWTLVIIYESPSFPSKFISVFDGYQFITGGQQVDYTINGFQTLPSPFPVRAKIGVSALEGEPGLLPDSYSISSNPLGPFTVLGNFINPLNNFFNSSISEPIAATPFSAYVTTRNPNSINTLGFDLDQVNIPNPGNSVIPNGSTSATLRLRSDGDAFAPYLQTFAVDIIEPKILVTKTVKDTAGNPLVGNVTLGQSLVYDITYQNLGNDDALNFTIKDILPINLIGFNISTDLTLPVGVTATYSILPVGTGGTVTFTIPNSQVNIGDPFQTIQIRVKVVSTCNQLVNACSNIIKNQAFATYSGALNNAQITDDPSISSFTLCNVQPASTTNFLVGVTGCVFTQNIQLCGDSVTVTAATGFPQHIWTTVAPFGSPGAVIIPGTAGLNLPIITLTAAQVTALLVSGVATIYVRNDGANPCLPTDEVISITPFALSTTLHPVRPATGLLATTPIAASTDIDSIAICSSLGTETPIINLCGSGDTRTITTGITGAVVKWYRLDTVASGCALGTLNCPRSLLSEVACWNVSPPVFTGPTYSVSVAGQYRIVVTYGNGCTNTFYFNVFKNDFTPFLLSQTNIICGNPPQITIGGVPSGGAWQFSLQPGGPYQLSNVFSPTSVVPISGTAAGTYTVYVSQVGSGLQGCRFTIPNINISIRNLTTTATVTNALCFGGQGSVNIAAIGVNNVVNNVQTTQYRYRIFTSPGGVQVADSGLITSDFYSLTSIPAAPTLVAGCYTYTITTSNNCTASGNFCITTPPLLTATITETIKTTSCADGLITVIPSGGTAPYTYVVNGGSPLTSSSFTPEQLAIPVPITGPYNYNVVITDVNNCTKTVTITVIPVPPPVFNVSPTVPVACYGTPSSSITVNVTNPNGATLLYSITPGAPLASFILGTATGITFPNLSGGTYPLIIQYTVGTAVCYTPVQNVVIAQPFAALTASGGVTVLACGTPSLGTVAITNPQGGTLPYSYNFNNGIGAYIASNTAQVPPGTYTIYIKDAAGCTFPMSVTINAQPNSPTIFVSNTSFNCNGSSTVTATISNTSNNFDYTYTLDGGAPNTNIPPNVFTNVPTGSHTICVNYTPNFVPTFSNLLFEDFGIGANTTTPGIASAYCFNNQQLPSTCPNPTQQLEDNQYVVTSAINPNNGAWFQFRDHTSASPGPINPNGRFLAVNIGGAAGANGVLYSKTISSIAPNQPIIVEAYLANLLRSNFTGGSDPSFVFEVRNGATLLAQSPVLPATDPILRSDTWQLKSVSLNPPVGGFPPVITFNVLSGSTDYGGNDALIDDIKVYQLPQLCTTQRCFPLVVPAGNAFAAQFVSSTNVTCNGTNNATATIAAQNFNTTNGFQYNINGGTWVTSLISPVTFPVPLGVVTISVRFDATSTVGNCQINLPPVTITQPPILSVTTAVTSATCLQGAIITATATGGSGNYQYQLVNAATSAIVTAYSNSNVFSPVASGTYNVFVKDLNGCISQTTTIITILPLVTLTATISPLSDFCFDSVNAATLTVVPVGVGPFTYTLNGAGNTVTNPIAITTPGPKTIIVTDTATSCSFTLPVINIAPQLSVSLVETQSLRCNTVPALTEIITGTVAGGYPGTTLTPALAYDYTYQVSTDNGSTFSAPVQFTGTTFVYNSTLTTVTSYVFLIKDGRGCQVQSNTFQVPAIQYPTGTSTQTPVVCYGDPTGCVNITPSGGVGPYQITLTPVPVTGTNPVVIGLPGVTSFCGLIAGNYNYVITSTTTGCASQGVLSQTVTSLTAAALIASYNVIPLGCVTGVGNSGLGQICVTGVSGGAAPYTYTIAGGPNPPYPSFTAPSAGINHCFTGLYSGIYTLTITDANGCTKVFNNVLLSNPPSDITIVAQPVVTANCAGGTCVRLSVIVGGGTLSPPGSYFFSIYTATSGIPPFVTYPTGYTPADLTLNPAGTELLICNLIPGNVYTYVVYDSFTGCYKFVTAPPIPIGPSGFAATAVPHNVSCKGNADGYVNSFTISNYQGATSVDYQLYSTATNLPITAVFNQVTPVAGTPVTVNNTFLGLINTLLPTGLAPGQYYIKFTLMNGPNAGCTTAAPFSITESATALAGTAVKIKNANCNNLAGQIQITSSFGTSPYTYLVQPSSFVAPPSIPLSSAAWQAFLTTINLTTTVVNTNGGTFNVYIKDANDCVIVVPVTVPIDPLPTVNPIVVTNQCTSTTNLFNFTATGTGIGSLTFSLTPGSPTFGTGVYTNIAPGTYTVTVKDGNGCIGTRVLVIFPQLLFSPQPLALPTCILNNDGSIVMNTSGGSGTFTYTISPNVGTFVAGNPASYTGLPAGTYNVSITDTTTACPPKTVPVTLIAPTPVTLNPPTITNTTCFGSTSTDGAFTVNLVTPTAVVNNNPVYTYSITAAPVAYSGPLNTPVPTNTFTNLPAGSYTVRVTSGRLCFVDQVIVVGQPALIVISAPVVTQFGCSANSNTPNLAQINANPVAGAITGGSGIYVNYEFIGPAPSTTSLYSGPNSTYTVGNFAGGTYTIIVTDNKGCKGTITAVVNPFVGITNGSVTVTTPITCTNLQSMTVNVNPAPLGSGITPPNITYTLVGANGTTFGPIVQVNNPNFTGLIIGDYAITILNNTTGCSIVINHYVFNPNTFNLVVPPTSPVSCLGGNNGSATVTIVDTSVVSPAVGAAGPFNFTYQQGTVSGGVFTPSGVLITGTSPNPGPVLISGLAAGTYQVNVTLSGSPGCSVTTYFTIGSPATAFSLGALVTSPITCVPGNNGTITASALGGWGNYTYQIVPSGSNPPGFSANNYFTGLAAGTYTINVRDTTALNTTPCLLTTSITLSVPVPLTATATATPLLLPCFGSQTASISVTALNGAGPGTYTYVLNNVTIPSTQLTNSATNPITNPFFNGLGAGTYNVTVTDSWGCTFTTTPNIVITQPTIVTPSLALTTPQTCAVPTLATLTISASNGTGPYTYSTSATGPFSNPPFASSTTVQVPPSAVAYQYWIRDANNCTAVATNTVPVNPLVPLAITVSPTSVTSISCNGSASGVIYTNAIGGNAGVAYVYTLLNSTGAPIVLVGLTNPNPTGTFAGLVAGTYFVRVTSGDCIITSPAIIIVNANPPLSYGTPIITDVKCTGAGNGSVTINVTGGFGQIVYAITYCGPVGSPPIPNSASYSQINTFNNLQPGQYVIQYNDLLGCANVFPFIIGEPSPLLAVTGSVIQQAYCNGDTATFNMTVSGGTPPYSYSVGSATGTYTTGTLSPVQTAFIVSVLNGGNQTVYIKDANGCITTTTVVLVPAVTINPIATVTYNCPNDPTLNFVTVSVASTSVGLVTYSLDGGPFLPTFTSFTNLIPGLHYVNVRSTVVNNLCTIRVNFSVIAVPGLNMTLASGNLNQIIATVTGGTPPYTYDFNGVNTGNVNSYIITQDFNGNITATDVNGCPVVVPFIKKFIDILIPNYFTPTGDGINDGWGPRNTSNYKNLVTFVFDRYGRKIITLKEGEFWNGKYNGTELPSGDYWYVVKIDGNNGDREFVGNVTLYR